MQIVKNYLLRKKMGKVWKKYTKARLSGKIKRPKKCCVCSSNKRICGHHSNYNKYLEVIWLCASCHMKLHSQLRRIKSSYQKTREKEYTVKDFKNNKKIFNRFRKIFMESLEKSE